MRIGVVGCRLVADHYPQTLPQQADLPVSGKGDGDPERVARLDAASWHVIDGSLGAVSMDARRRNLMATEGHRSP